VLADDGIALFKAARRRKTRHGGRIYALEWHGLGKIAPAQAAARRVPPRRDRSAGQLSYFASHLRHASVNAQKRNARHQWEID